MTYQRMFDNNKKSTNSTNGTNMFTLPYHMRSHQFLMGFCRILWTIIYLFDFWQLYCYFLSFVELKLLVTPLVFLRPF